MGMFGKSLSITLPGSRNTEDPDANCLKTFCQLHIKTLVTLFLIFATILVIVMLVYAHKWRFEAEQAAAAAACLDVAVIGAGLSGSYAAWRLKDTGLRVQIFEMSDRVGGRFYTRSMPDMPDVKAELGAMYFSPQRHPLMNQTVHALDLQTKPGTTGSESEAMFFLRGVHLKQKDLNSGKIPYNLKSNEKFLYPYELKRRLLNNLRNVSEALRFPLGAQTKDGKYLYEQGYWNWLGHVASMEAYNYLSDTSLFRSVVANGNAALLATLNTDTGSRDSATLSDGMEALPEELVRKFIEANPRRHGYTRNHRLIAVSVENDLYKLNFTRTCTRNYVTTDLSIHAEACAKRIILAIPPRSLKHIQWDFLPKEEISIFHERLSSVHEIPALKMFFSYKYPWWLQGGMTAKHILTDMPNRRVVHIGEQERNGGEDTNVLLLVAFSDDTDVSYWQGLYNGKQFSASLSSISNVNVTDSIIDHVTLQLRAMFKVPDEVRNDAQIPYTAIIQDWTTDPYGAGWHLWKPGVNWNDMARKLTRPLCDHGIYIVGSAFCPGGCQMYAEGALQTVDTLLRNYFFVEE